MSEEEFITSLILLGFVNKREPSARYICDLEHDPSKLRVEIEINTINIIRIYDCITSSYCTHIISDSNPEVILNTLTSLLKVRLTKQV